MPAQYARVSERTGEAAMQAPLAFRVLLRMAGWIVPACARAGWLAGRTAELSDWWWLVERGELAEGGGGSLCRRAFADAFAERLRGIDGQQLARSAGFVPLAAGIAAALLALVSGGFAVTRSVVAIARDIQANPPAPGVYDWRSDRVFIYIAPILLAEATALALLVMGCLSLRALRWRYWSFFAFKVLVVAVLLPLFWIEIGTAVRWHIAATPWRVTAGLVMALGFVVAMGRAMIWCIADQRRRCPACLRRLVLPVTVGSWSSLFEPAATEMLCEDGHGALALFDTEMNGRDRWTELDDSWSAMFR